MTGSSPQLQESALNKHPASLFPHVDHPKSPPHPHESLIMSELQHLRCVTILAEPSTSSPDEKPRETASILALGERASLSSRRWVGARGEGRYSLLTCGKLVLCRTSQVLREEQGGETRSTLTDQHIATIKDAAQKLTGSRRRAFQAQVTLDYVDGNPRRAERVFGWSRQTRALRVMEVRSRSRSGL